MKRIYLLSLISLAAGGSCVPSSKNMQHAGNKQIPSITVSYPLRDGLSYATAVIIDKATEREGVEDEYRWIEARFTDYRVEEQSLEDHDKKPYDVILIKLADGSERNVYFDISRFFGKF